MYMLLYHNLSLNNVFSSVILLLDATVSILDIHYDVKYDRAFI